MTRLEQVTNGYTSLERPQVSSYLGNFSNAGIKDLALSFDGIYAAFGRLSLPDIELMLRDMQSDTYLLSFSMRGITGYVSKLPGGIRPCPFYLAVELKGRERAIGRMEEVGSGYEENFRRLSGTGLLIPIEDSLISQAKRATLH